MNIALIGYGKMGKEIEAIATARNHTIGLKLDSSNTIANADLSNLDVAIDFSTPNSAVDNIKACLSVKLPIIVGTTGWMDNFEEVKNTCISTQSALFYASNFSLGVNIMFNMNGKLARLMNPHALYNVSIEEIHHTEKIDSPSGTAISLAEGITNNLDAKSKWVNQVTTDEGTISILSRREGNVPGTHSVVYESSVDSIEIKHTAKGRAGFAIGAVVAAEWLQGKQGVFTMADLLKN
ncbi:MAG: 4-hydroxy-tetrahydrodipicolinate reductase [Bacteroidetes bacterium]|nr:MAG: 4-hydroxy-tetrahydrodipicolinate reductase [Bacteroidota bacterium]